MTARLPTGCYRLQFRNGMDFERATRIVPYLDQLGISHLYASPLFAATTGSTHGYDIINPNAIEPGLGGRRGLERLSQTLHDHDMGLVLDIVPNHMAFSVETPWLRDLLRHGSASRYARHFDADVADSRLRLPWLTEPFDVAASRSAFSIEDDPDGPVLVNDGLRVPLSETPALAAARAAPTPDAIRALHDDQPWRLTHWRTEQDAITHRRFFNVTGLIGVRVEDEGVFEDAHRLLFDLIDAGIVTGVRIDHIDGLADPAAYLERLKARIGEVPVWVEKILTGSERLPPGWPVEGTTGYVAARALGRLLTDREGLKRIDAVWRSLTGRVDPFPDVLADAKRQIVTNDLSAELWTLHGMLTTIAADDPVAVEFGPEMLRRALVELIAAFPRYRTYMTGTDIAEDDARLIRDAAGAAAQVLPDPGALPFLADVLTRRDARCGSFRLRFQQVTGAAIAKAQEDTAFYREPRLLSINEVGGEPDDEPVSVAAFHGLMDQRRNTMPHGLTLTSSHDTKRSEDARMRIAAISHAPAAFEAFHARCAALADDSVGPNLRWYLAQTVLAIHGTSADIGERLAEHTEKALREAKRTTFWTAPNTDVEEAARAYALDLAEAFSPLPEDALPIVRIADRLSLIQTALKLTVPGIPDVYQGCETGSYLLTDPDNRRPVDFDLLARALDDETILSSRLDRQKLAMTRTLLHLRRNNPALFAEGSYLGIDAPEGAGAFVRSDGDRRLTVAFAIDAAADDRLEGLGKGKPVWPISDPGGKTSPVRVWLVG